MVPDLDPQRRKLFAGHVPSEAPAAELASNGIGIGREVGGDCHGGAEPGEEVTRGVRRWSEGGEPPETAGAQLVWDEGGAVGGDANETFARLALAVGEVAGEFLFGGLRLATQVGLELEDGVSEKGVRAAVDFGKGALKLDLRAAGAEALDEQAGHQSANLLVSRTRQQFEDDLAKTILCNSHYEANPPLSGWSHYRASPRPFDERQDDDVERATNRRLSDG